MFDHPVPWLLGVLGGFATAIAAAIATRVQLLPELIDISIVPTSAGSVGLLFAGYGAARRFGPDRLGRITLFGNLFGGALSLLILLLIVLIEVLF